MRRFTLILTLGCLCLKLSAQTQEEIAVAQKEYMQQMAQLMNCDSLKKILDTQIKTVDSAQISKEQWLQIKKSVKDQIDNCKENGSIFGESLPSKKPIQEANQEREENLLIPGATKSKISQFEMPSAYKISYIISDSEGSTAMDLYLAANNPNYGMMTKDPETGADFYSVFKDANKMMYMIGKGYIMAYDFGKFQKSGQSLTPTSEEMMKYKLKPTGTTENIAGYLCKELAGKTDDDSILRVWISYAIKSGSNVVPGARYLISEKAAYKKFYGTSELGFFLKASTTDKDGTTTIIAKKVQANPAQIKINTAGYQYIDASNMMNMYQPKN